MVPTQTEFAHALSQPYNVIHSIINRREGNPLPVSGPTDADVVAHFRSLFSDRDRTVKIPALTPESLPALLANAQTAAQTETKLVRWRCMIQDTGFASEVYQSYQLEEDCATAPGSSSGAQPGALYSAFGLDFAVSSAAGDDNEAATDTTQDGGNNDCSGNGASSSSTSINSAAAAKIRAQRKRETESLRERSVMYAVSVPGETPWARRAYGDANVQEDGESLDDFPSASFAALSLGETANEVATSSRAANAAASSSGPANPFSYKSPVPEDSHVAGLLKFYDVDDVESSLQVTQVIEAVGILEATPFRTDDWQDLGFADPTSASASSSSASTTYVGPCLHVLFYTPLPASTIPQALTEARTPSLTGLASAPAIRAGLIAYLKDALGGDELAAEFLLLTLLARIHSRRGGADGAEEGGASSGAEGTGIGGLSLNLSNVPETKGGDSSATSKPADAKATPPAPPLPKLQRALRKLVPALVHQPLSLVHLNAPEVTLSPRAGAAFNSSLDSGESLQAGRLQLPKGTLVLVDEVGMGEGGQLKEGGVRNLQALAGVMRTHRLEYEYPYNRFSFEADLRVVVLSAGKSFLPADVHLPLEFQPEEGQSKGGAGAAESEEPGADTLRLYRLLLLQARYAPFTIDEQDGVAEKIAADFVEARKRAAVAKRGQQPAPAAAGSSAAAAPGESEGMATQEDLLGRMSIARLLALSRSESKLTIDTWIRAGELDEARLERVRKLPIGRPSAEAQQK
ncbi:hypothetical protein V8E36_001172 [Tilletia maclaganii]